MSGETSEFGEEHLQDTREERPRPRAASDHRRIRTSDRISTEFIVLVEQLLALHVNEVESAKSEIELLRQEVHQRDSMRDSEVIHFRQTLMSVDEDSEEPLHDWSRGSKRSSQGERNGESKISQVTVRSTCKSKELLCKQHETLLPVDAEQLIDILDENALDLDEVFQEKPNIEPEAVPGLLSDTASVLATRYRALTAFEKMQYWLQSSQYEMSIFFVLYLNVLFMALELHISGLASWQELSEEYIFSQQDLDSWHTVFTIGDVFFASVFVLDVVVRLFVLRCSFWKTWLNYIDIVVSLFSLAEVTIVYAVTFPVNPIIFRLLRIGKMVRAVRMVAVTSQMGSLQLLVKCLASSRDMLLSSFSILTFVQCVAGVILSTLCVDFINDETQDKTIREEVWKYYGSFSRTFLTMFEIFFANWGPACRVLVENVSEWFSIFFLIYRCVLGFAVLNVMNAVFVQQTMRTAVMDEDLAYKQRQKEIDQYTKKVKTLFQGLDSTGDGSINLEEFSKLVKSDKLAFWMSQLELEYHDLLQLFEFLDNGDGQITLTEFIDGAARLRGGAKAIDVWRMETKLEVLFEEVLEALSETRKRRSTVQDVLRSSSFQFISSNSSHLTPAQDAMSAAARNSLLVDAEDEQLIQGIASKRNSVFGLL